MEDRTNEIEEFDELINQLNSENWEEAKASSEKLASLGQKVVLPLLETIFNQPPRTRTLIVTVLGKIGDKRALEPVILMLKDESVEVRAEVAGVLGWDLMDERAIAPLIRALQEDEDVEVRESAADALGNLGDERAIPYLEYAARYDAGMSEYSSVADEALNALSRIRNKTGESIE